MLSVKLDGRKIVNGRPDPRRVVSVWSLAANGLAYQAGFPPSYPTTADAMADWRGEGI